MTDFIVGPGARPSEYRTLPLWQIRGWTNTAKGLEGRYKTARGEFWGLIKIHSKTNFQFFIFQPPSRLNGHPKQQCFVPVGSGWYCIHFSVAPSGIDDGITKIEAILAEALTGRH